MGAASHPMPSDAAGPRRGRPRQSSGKRANERATNRKNPDVRRMFTPDVAGDDDYTTKSGTACGKVDAPTIAFGEDFVPERDGGRAMLRGRRSRANLERGIGDRFRGRPPFHESGNIAPTNRRLHDVRGSFSRERVVTSHRATTSRDGSGGEWRRGRRDLQLFAPFRDERRVSVPPNAPSAGWRGPGR